MTISHKFAVSVILATALGACAPAPAPKSTARTADSVCDEPLSRSQLITLESYLNQLGYLASAPDGRVGPDSRLAIAAYQQAAGLPPNGCYSNALIGSLGNSIDNRALTANTKKTTTTRRSTSPRRATTATTTARTTTSTPKATKPPTTTAATKPPATTRQIPVPGSEGGGGGGGGGGGAGGW